MSNSKHEHLRAPGQIAYGGSRAISASAFYLLGGIKVIGGENIQNRQGGYAQAYNHSSILDIPALGLAAVEADDQQLYYMSKDENNKLAIGYYLKRGGSFYVSRKTGLTPQQHVWMGKELFAKKAAVAIAPQGHRYPNKLSRESYKALILGTVAFFHGIEVVPTAIVGTTPGDIGHIHVGYAEPIKAEKVDITLDPEWTATRFAGEVLKAAGRKAVADFMDQVYASTVATQTLITQIRSERLQEPGHTLMAGAINHRKAKPRGDLKL